MNMVDIKGRKYALVPARITPEMVRAWRKESGQCIAFKYEQMLAASSSTEAAEEIERLRARVSELEAAERLALSHQQARHAQTHAIDVALNGLAGAAPNAQLIDILSQVESAVRKSGHPILPMLSVLESAFCELPNEAQP